MTVRLNNVIVGGEPVGFTKSTGTLHLAGGDLTLKEWQELEKSVNKLYARAGLLKKESKGDPNSGTSSFLTMNLREILSREGGIIKGAPWWLKGMFSGVITKEHYVRD